MNLAMFLATPVTMYTVNLPFGNYFLYQRQIVTFIFEISSLVCSSSTFQASTPGFGYKVHGFVLLKLTI